MTAAQSAEAQARLCASLREIAEFYEVGGCSSSSITKFNDLINTQQYFDVLELAEGYSKCMAFIDHDELVRKLGISWGCFEDCLNIEKKIINRRLRNLEGDKNADPDLIAKLHNIKSELEQKLARIMVYKIKFIIVRNYPIRKFMDKTYDPMEERMAQMAEKKRLQASNAK
jgi:hypothetical protein